MAGVCGAGPLPVRPRVLPSRRAPRPAPWPRRCPGGGRIALRPGYPTTVYAVSRISYLRRAFTFLSLNGERGNDL